MNCLNEQQFMELLYKEGDALKLKEYKDHIFQCKKCMKEFIELMEVRDYLQDIKEDNISPVVIITQPKTNINFFNKFALIAASLILAFSVLFSFYQVKKIEHAEKRIARVSMNLEKQVEEVSYKTEKTAKDNYLLIMGLKNYIDSAIMNQQNTRRASYEKF